MKKKIDAVLQDAKQADKNSRMYSEIIMELWRFPENHGKLNSANLIEKGSNLSCGDEVIFYLEENKGIVKDASFDGKGCAICIASSSLLAGEIKGKKLNSIMKMNDSHMIKIIGVEVHPARRNCMMLGLTTIQKAIKKKFD